MKLKSLDSFKALNNQEQQIVMGGAALAINSECWEDSTSCDSYKRDTGGCSKKRDTPGYGYQ